MGNAKYYCIVESCYEYNDDWYEEEGTLPRSVFTNKEEAEKACLEANYEWFYNNKLYVPFYGVGNTDRNYPDPIDVEILHRDLEWLNLMDRTQLDLLQEEGYDKHIFDSVFSKIGKEDRYLILKVFINNLVYGFQVVEVDFKG